MSAELGSPALEDETGLVLQALLAMQRQSWEQGVASQALLDLGQDRLVKVMARDAVTRQTPTGKLADISDQGAVNSGAAGEAVLWAAQRSSDPALAAAFQRQVQWFRVEAPRAPDGTLFHLENKPECWVDSVYMIVPLLVLAGHVDEAALQLSGHRRRLFDASSGLYGWRWDENLQQVTHPEHWGTGNGWVVAGVARSLRLLTDRSGSFARDAADHARTVIDACLAHRSPTDGLFHNIIDDESTFLEANLAQMLAYGILTGVADDWLPASYRDVGISLRESARQRVDGHGFVTGVCGAPHFDRSGTSAEAQAFYLLAAAAAQRLS